MARLRKTVSLFLVLCLAITMIPAEALADGADDSAAEVLAEEESGGIILEDESAETQQPAETEGSTGEQETEDGETPQPVTPAVDPGQSENTPAYPEDDPVQPEGESTQPEDNPSQPEGQLQPTDNVGSDPDEQSGIPEENTSAPVDVLDITPPEENCEGEIVTRIAWIHELASRFSASPEDYGFADIAFSDYSQSEEYYQDAVWAWNMGLFPENDDLSIDPFASATYEFSADTLCSCLDLRLSTESSAYAVTASVEDSGDGGSDGGADSMEIAERRGWFNGDAGAPDANLTSDALSTMLSDAEEIVSLAEVQENYDSTYTYASGVIEVPQEIGFEISPDETAVTLYSEDLSIEAGDDFVVYMDSLPIAYRALEVTAESGSTTIIVEKADPSVYEYVDEQGCIALTADNAEFIPEEGVTALADGFDFSNGKLSLSTSVGGSKAEIYLENLSLNHSFSNDSVTVTVNGSWGLTTTLANKDEVGPEIPLGKLRILGVGVIGVSLKLSMGAEMSGTVSGTFSAGVSSMSDGTTRGIHSFSVTNCSVTGKAKLSASMKISAGVDIVLAQAVVYGEVGAETQYTDQTKRNSNDELIHCQDYKYYFFLTVGAELNYYAFWKGEMSTLASKDFPIMDDTKGPYVRQWHWENGAHVSSCTMGMTVADQSNLYSGGSTVNIGTSLAQENMERALETTVTLPSDYTVSGDYTINQKAALNTNGYAFTVTGNLILNGGTLTVNGGTLNVNGDLIINKGSVTANSSGVINLKGSLRQTASTGGSFTCNGKIVLCGAGSQQSFYFESPSVGKFSSIDLNGHNLQVTGNMQTSGDLNLDGHSMTVQGNLTITGGTIDLYGGTLTVKGNVLQTGGTMFVDYGTLDIAGDYDIAKGFTVNPDGTKTYSGNSDGEFRMNSASDIVRIGGSFYMRSTHAGGGDLTAGTMYIAGDFFQCSGYSYNFCPEGSHTIVFNGVGKQRIYFEDYPSSKFNILQLTQPTSQYIFSPDPCWTTLYEFGSQPQLAVTSVNLSARTLTLLPEETYTFTASVLPANVADKSLVWSSSNEAVATVDQSGKVTAISQGTASIRATASNGVYRSCTVTVTDVFTGIITAVSGNALPSASIFVPITIWDNPGIAALRLNVAYDSSILTFTGVEAGEVLSGGKLSSETGSGSCRVLWYDSADHTGNGVLCTLQFQVAANAKLGGKTAVSLSYGAGDICDADHNNFGFKLEPCELLLKQVTKGDIYEDGVVDAHDILLLQQHLTNLAKLSGRQLAAADLDNSGDVNMKDIVSLAKKLLTSPMALNDLAVLSGTFQADVLDAEFNANGYADVPVRFSGCSGIAAFRFLVNYDANFMDLVGITPASAIAGDRLCNNLTDANREEAVITWYSAENHALDGTVFTLRFRLKNPSAQGRRTVAIDFRENDICTASLNTLSLDTRDGQVKTPGYIGMELSKPVVNVSGARGSVSCIVTFEGTKASEVKTMAAFYDANHKMLAVWAGNDTLQNGKQLTLTGRVPTGYHTVKFFLLSKDGYAPLCEASDLSAGR